MGELAMLTLSGHGIESRNLSDSPARMVMRISERKRAPPGASGARGISSHGRQST